MTVKCAKRMQKLLSRNPSLQLPPPILSLNVLSYPITIGFYKNPLSANPKLSPKTMASSSSSAALHHFTNPFSGGFRNISTDSKSVVPRVNSCRMCRCSLDTTAPVRAWVVLKQSRTSAAWFGILAASASDKGVPVTSGEEEKDLENGVVEENVVNGSSEEIYPEILSIMKSFFGVQLLELYFLKKIISIKGKSGFPHLWAEIVSFANYFLSVVLHGIDSPVL